MSAGEEHLYTVFTEPVSGKEQAFEEWYDKRHLPEILALPGFAWGRRYEAVDADDGPRYLTVYGITGDPRIALGAMRAAAEAGELDLGEGVNDRSRLASRLWRATGDSA
jgi:hypothetical protein